MKLAVLVIQGKNELIFFTASPLIGHRNLYCQVEANNPLLIAYRSFYDIHNKTIRNKITLSMSHHYAIFANCVKIYVKFDLEPPDD